MFEVGQTVKLNSDAGEFEVILRNGDYVETDSKGNPVEVYHNADSITYRLVESGKVHGVGPDGESVVDWMQAKLGM